MRYAYFEGEKRAYTDRFESSAQLKLADPDKLEPAAIAVPEA